MVKKKEADVTSEKATGKSPDQTAEKTRRKSLAQLIAALKAQGGKCYVTGAELGDDTADIDGKLVTGAVKKYAGRCDLAALRTKLEGDLEAAGSLILVYGNLISKDGAVMFAGETAAKNADEKGAQ